MPGDPFPTTKFVPWATFLRDRKGGQRTIEQPELVALLREQSRENPDQIDMDEAIKHVNFLKTFSPDFIPSVLRGDLALYKLPEHNALLAEGLRKAWKPSG